MCLVVVCAENKGLAWCNCKCKGKYNVSIPTIACNSLNPAPDAEELSASRLHCCTTPLENSPHSLVGPWAGLDVWQKIKICLLSWCLQLLVTKKNTTPPGGLEPPTFRLTAERASRLRHGGLRGSNEMGIREVLRSCIGLETSYLDCVVLSSHSTRIIE